MGLGAEDMQTVQVLTSGEHSRRGCGVQSSFVVKAKRERKAWPRVDWERIGQPNAATRYRDHQLAHARTRTTATPRPSFSALQATAAIMSSVGYDHLTLQANEAADEGSIRTSNAGNEGRTVDHTVVGRSGSGQGLHGPVVALHPPPHAPSTELVETATERTAALKGSTSSGQSAS